METLLTPMLETTVGRVVGSFVAQTAVVQAANAKLLGGQSNVEVSKTYATLATPAGWAFAIWGVIYAWEAAGCAYLLFVVKDGDASLSPSLERAAPFVVAANVFQLLWAVVFTRARLNVAAVLLAGIAVSLLVAQERVRGCTTAERRLIAWPLNLHAGWVTVATLLSFNLCLVRAKISVSRELAAAFATVYAAVGAAVLAACLRGNVLYCAAIAWALLGIYAELPASKAAPGLGPDGRDALRLTAGVAAGLVAHLSVTALVYGLLVEPWDA